MIALQFYLTQRSVRIGRFRGPYVQVLASKRRECPGPGLEAAQAVPDLGGGGVEKELTVFLLKNRSERGLPVILGTGADCAGLQTSESLHHQLGADRRQFRRDPFGGISRADGALALEEDVAGVEARINTHGRDPGDGLSTRDGPLDGRRAPILWQKGCMHVKVAKGWKVDHPLRDDAAVANDDEGIRFELGELIAKILVVLDLVGLSDRKAELQGSFLNRRRRQLHPAATRSVRRGDDQAHGEPGLDQLL